MQLPFASFLLLMPLLIADSAATNADSDTFDGELVASDADSTATDADSATSDEAAEEMGWDIEGEPTQEQVAAFFKFARERAMKKLAAEEERRRRREGAHGDGLLHFDGADVRVERARVGHEDGRKGDRGVPQTAVRA